MKSTTNLLLVLLVWCISFSTNAQCPNSLSGFTYLGELDNHKYFISNESNTWNTSKSNAEANGGYLASITSQEENDFILVNINTIVFIGYNDADSEGDFEWDSGEPTGFNKFADTNTDEKDYGKMNFWNGSWGVDQSSVKRRSIVEIPCSSSNECPDLIEGFTAIGEFGDSKYFLSNSNAKPEDAQAEAASNGGYLAVISSEEENEFIQQNIDMMSFIGLNDVAAEGDLEWVNGEPLSYNNINPYGFCEENSADQDYVIIAPWDGSWSFSSKYNSRPYVMEIPCNGGGGIDECSFNTAISTVDAGSVRIAKFSENTSNSTYELYSRETDNFLSRETYKYSIDAATGELVNTTTITRTGTADESDYETYWDRESNILYGVRDISTDLLELWAKDSQGNFIFSKNIDVSDIEFVFPYVRVVHNELILTASSTSTNTFPIIKTDINGNLIWKKEIPSNVMSGVGIQVFSESKAGGFYLFYEFTDAFIFKLSDEGDLEWTGDLNTPNPAEIILVLGESGDGERFYIKRLSFGFDTKAYLAAFEVSTGNIVWDFNSGESDADGAEFGSITYQAIPANDGGVALFYYYYLLSDPDVSIYRHKRFDNNGNLMWERDTPEGIPSYIGENKMAATDGGFVVAGESFQIPDTTWRIVRMTSDGYFEPDCNDSGGGNCDTFIPGPISGFTYKANVGTKYYYLSDDAARPTDAQANCVSNGGNLATVTSQEIADALQAETNGFVYIGLHDENTEGTLEWRSGENSNFTNFDDCGICEPNTEDRDYVVMQGWNGKWSWNNFYNNRRYWLELDCNDINSNNINTLITLPKVEKKELLDLQKIVPNPASDHIFVQVRSETEMAIDIEIYDTRGMLLKSQPAELFDGINATEVDIADFPSGFYLVKIPQMKGNFIVKRFVKVKE